jgi:hypothetical protein
MLNKRIKKTQLACLPCQRSHYSCDNERPCGSCLRKGRTHECIAGTTKKLRHPQSTKTMGVMPAGSDLKDVPVDLSFTGFDWWILDLATRAISVTNTSADVIIDMDWGEDWLRMAMRGEPVRKVSSGTREFYAVFLQDEFNIPIYALIYELPNAFAL